jgi:hypothetical protein
VKRVVPASILFLLLACGTGPAQTPSGSPVFRSYQPPGPGSLVVQSDVTYQMWQTFQLTRQANAGDALAQHELGIRYLAGNGVPADTARGAYWTGRAAAQRVIPAQFNLGILLMNGWGVAWDPFAAFQLFERAAQSGMREAQYLLGSLYLDNLVVPRSLTSAYRWVSASADSGYEPARVLREELQPQVPGRGTDSTRGAAPGPAAQPRQTAAPWAPVFLAFGPDTSREETEGEFFARVARSDHPAVRGLVEGLDSLGAVDAARRRLLRDAADAGSPEAVMALAWLALRPPGAGGDVLSAAEMLVRGVRLDAPHAGGRLWDLLGRADAAAAVVRGIRAGNPRAAYVAAMLQALGLHPPLLGAYAWLPEEDALGLLRASAAAGFPPAVLELGLCHYTGRWVRRDTDSALAVWTSPAGSGALEGVVRRTVAMLQEGRGDPVVQRAVLEDAVGRGSVLAQVALATCEEQGIGGRMDAGAAARLYREAAVRGSQDAFRALRRMHDDRRPEEPRFRLPQEG